MGTSFNIKSFEGKTEVIVETGIVEVEKKNLKVMLQSNEKVTVPNSDSTFTKENSTDKLYTYFRSKEFVCDVTPLWKVVEVLNDAYDAKIIIEKKGLRDKLLTTTFINKYLEKILAVIAETFRAVIVKKDNQLILK